MPDPTLWESLGTSADGDVMVLQNFDSVFELNALGQDLLADGPLGYFRMVDMCLVHDGIRCDGRSAFGINACMEAGVYEACQSCSFSFPEGISFGFDAYPKSLTILAFSRHCSLRRSLSISSSCLAVGTWAYEARSSIWL